MMPDYWARMITWLHRLMPQTEQPMPPTEEQAAWLLLQERAMDRFGLGILLRTNRPALRIADALIELEKRVTVLEASSRSTE